MTEITYRNIEAEQAVIGAALIDQNAAKLVADMETDVFNEPQHRVIHACIKRLVNVKKLLTS